MNLWQRIRAAYTTLRQPVESRVHVPHRQAGVLVTEDTALTLPEWWACVSVITRTVAALPWGVYERTSAGRKPVHGTVEWLLNNQPNPEMTAFAFREVLMAHVLNWGNGYAEIERDLSGRPVALLLLTPDRVRVCRDEAGAITYHVGKGGGSDGWDAGWSPIGDDAILRADQVLHVHGLGFDGMVGYSVVNMAARSIGIGIAQDTFGQAFYANGTQFGSMVEVPHSMNPEQIKQMESYLNDTHRGPDKAFRIKVVSNGTKASGGGMPLTDAQFIESRQLSVTTAARWLGVPPHKIADLTRSTFSNIEQQGIEFVTDAIVPWATRLEQEANVKLFGARAQGRVYTKLCVNALMRGDSAARAAFYRTMTQIGAMTINEVRELEDMNGIGPAGDVPLVQLNQTTLDWLVENPGAKAPKPTTAPAPDDSADAAAAEDPAADPPTNVIRAQALEWARQRKQA